MVAIENGPIFQPLSFAFREEFKPHSTALQIISLLRETFDT